MSTTEPRESINKLVIEEFAKYAIELTNENHLIFLVGMHAANRRAGVVKFVYSDEDLANSKTTRELIDRLRANLKLNDPTT